MFSRKAVYATVSRLLALALLAAGAFKGRDLLLGVQGSQGFWDDRRVMAGIVCLEIAFSLWLLVGLFPRPTRWLAVLCFGTFLCFAVASALAGEISCGCAGSIAALNPWHTATFDLFAVVALIAGGSVSSSAATRRSMLFRFAAFATLLLVVGGGGLWVAHHFAAVSLGVERGIREGAGVVALDPEKWTGQRLPLLPFVVTKAELNKGTWILVLVHPNRPKCRAVLPNYEKMAREWRKRGLSARVAVIEVPSRGSSAHREAIYPSQTVCTHGRLIEEKEWFVQTPVQIKIVEGVVVEAATL